MSNKRTLKKKVTAVIAAALVIFIISPLSRYMLSLGVMSVYSRIHREESIMAEKGMELDIPGGLETPENDWYPFVMTFNPGESFAEAAKDDSLKLTILYNFGAFDLRKGCSRLYDRQSEYYNSFYGAYMVTRRDDGSEAVGDSKTAPFGFDSHGCMETEQAVLVPKFDFQKLVLGDFGIKSSEQVFEWKAETISEDVSYLGCNGWTRVDASLLVNGAAHKKKAFRQSYLQYGAPKYEVGADEEFKPIAMRGRVYGRFFEEWDTSVFFYILTPEMETLERCDREILSKSRLE